MSPNFGLVRSDRVILTSDNPRSEDPNAIIEEVFEGISQIRLKQVTHIVDRKEAIHWCLTNLNPKDILLIAGKGHETEQIIGTETINFDDREVIREWSS